MSIPPAVEQFARTGVLQFPTASQPQSGPDLRVVSDGESIGATGTAGDGNVGAGTVPMGFVQIQQPGVVQYQMPQFYSTSNAPASTPDWQQILAARLPSTNSSQFQQAPIPSSVAGNDGDRSATGITLPNPTAPLNPNQAAEVAAAHVELLRAFLEYEGHRPPQLQPQPQPQPQPMVWHPYYGWMPTPYQLPLYQSNQALPAIGPNPASAEQASAAPLEVVPPSRIIAIESDDEGENMRNPRSVSQSKVIPVARRSGATISKLPLAESDQPDDPSVGYQENPLREFDRDGRRLDTQVDTPISSRTYDLRRDLSTSASRHEESDFVMRSSFANENVRDRESRRAAASLQSNAAEPEAEPQPLRDSVRSGTWVSTYYRDSATSDMIDTSRSVDQEDSIEPQTSNPLRSVPSGVDSGNISQSSSGDAFRTSHSSASVLARQSANNRMSALSAISSKAYSNKIPPSRALASQSLTPLRVSALVRTRPSLPSSPRHGSGMLSSPRMGQENVLSTVSQLRTTPESSVDSPSERAKSYVRTRSSSPSGSPRRESTIPRVPSILQAGHATGVKRLSEIPNDGVPWSSGDRESSSSFVPYPLRSPGRQRTSTRWPHPGYPDSDDGEDDLDDYLET